ncbi:MAG: Zn-ribbon domain-containing OB-fold protein [Acetobacteraceae bacterium]
MDTSFPTRPRPAETPETRPFWDGCRRGELLLQRCEACQSVQFPPRAACLACRSGRLGWMRSAGRGTIYSVTVVRRAPTSAFQADIPYAVALIELDEGVRIMTNLRGCAPEEAAIGQNVEIVFEDRGDGVVLPQAIRRG